MSLVDQSMIPFQTAYPMIVFMIFLILAGNTAFVSCCIISYKCILSARLVPANIVSRPLVSLPITE